MLAFKRLTAKLSKSAGVYHKLERTGKTKRAIFDTYITGIKDTNINVIQGVFDHFLHIAFLLRVNSLYLLERLRAFPG